MRNVITLYLRSRKDKSRQLFMLARVPENISIVGFDDIKIAAYNNPSLTTVRQPLERMGEIAARTLLDRIENHEDWIFDYLVSIRDPYFSA